MVERLLEEECQIINENWNEIKKNVLEYSKAEIKIKEFTIKAEKELNRINLVIINKNKSNVFISASINAKIMTFKLQKEEKKIDKKELIYEPSSIIYFIKYFEMQHPIFKKNEDNEFIDISVTKENSEEIFDNPYIKEIIDDCLESYIKKDDFLTFKKELKEISDYYDEFSFKEYSNLAQIINQQSSEMITGEGRNNLIEFLRSLYLTKEKIVILTGAQKIGLTFSVLKIVKYYSILYLDLNTIFTLNKSDKKKYILNKFINLFRDYNDYHKFVVENIIKLQGYENILSILEEMILIVSKKLENIIIIIDNYDDYLVGEKKLSSIYLDKIYNIIKYSNVKILFIGRGKFISNLLIDFFYDKSNIKKYILFKYYKTLDLNIENIIHSYYEENQKNDIDLYYNKNPENNFESIISNLLIIKNLNCIIEKDFRDNFPFQFFLFSKKEKEDIKIEYQFDDLINLNNIILREYITKLDNVALFYENTTPFIKGLLFKELVISDLMNNKNSFSNLKFPKNNIIEVESIYEMKDDVETLDNLENGPILIIQLKGGKVFDFGIIIENNGMNCFIGGQIDINNTYEEIREYNKKISNSYDNILNKLKTLTGRIITEFKFIIIFNKETQISLKKEYDQKFKRITEYDKKVNDGIETTVYEDEQNQRDKEDIFDFNSQYGSKCCEDWNISYLFFSYKDLCFYKEDKKIDFFNINEIKRFKTGFELFCINEYNLIPCTVLEPILKEEEKSQFIIKLKEMYSDITDIKINYKINEKINLLTATPENYGILSIYSKIKVFSYYDGKFTVFIIKDDGVTKYENIDFMKYYQLQKGELLEQYFIELIYEGEEEKNDKEQKDENKMDKRNPEIDIDEDIENNKNIKEDEKSSKKKIYHRKEEQRKECFKNHLKYLQSKRRYDSDE